jgi:hypothetical protein
MTQAVAAQAMHRSRALVAKASFSSIRQRTCGEHERSVCANQKERGCHCAAVPHAIRRVMDGLGEQIVERFKLSWRLHHRDFGPPAAKNQAARAREAGQGMDLGVIYGIEVCD